MKESVEDFKEVWSECLRIIRDNIPQKSYNTWFTPIKPIGLTGQILTVQVPSLYYHEWIEGNYWQLLKTAIQKVLGVNGKLEYKILVTNETSITLPPAGAGHVDLINKPPLSIAIDEETDKKSIPNPFVLPGLKKLNIQSQLNKDLNFENFVEGECNRLARAAGFAIASDPKKTPFNPFFIY